MPSISESVQFNIRFSRNNWIVTFRHTALTIQIGSVSVLRKEYFDGVVEAGAKVVLHDAELVASIRSGHEGAMSHLYDRYSGIVYAVALRVLNDTAAAEDVLQEVFMQLWRKPASFNSTRGSLGAWLAVITRHRAIDLLRKRKPEANFEEVIIPANCDLESEAGRKKSIERVRGVMAAMPTEQRSALELAFFEGLTHTEISAKT